MFHVVYHVNHICYLMVGELPTSSIQQIRTWKWRIRTPSPWWWSERIFATLSVCIVFHLVHSKSRAFALTFVNTNTGVSRNLVILGRRRELWRFAWGKRWRMDGLVEDGQMERHLYTATSTWPWKGDTQAPWGEEVEIVTVCFIFPRYTVPMCALFFFLLLLFFNLSVPSLT